MLTLFTFGCVGWPCPTAAFKLWPTTRIRSADSSPTSSMKVCRSTRNRWSITHPRRCRLLPTVRARTPLAPTAILGRWRHSRTADRWWRLIWPVMTSEVSVGRWWRHSGLAVRIHGGFFLLHFCWRICRWFADYLSRRLVCVACVYLKLFLFIPLRNYGHYRATESE